MQGDTYLLMISNRLYKNEKLCSRTAIDDIFSSGASLIAYPLRVAYRVTSAERPSVKFMITIPKKKIRTAVARVLLRRRAREAYRLNRNIILPTVSESGKSLEVVFLYLAKDIVDYSVINTKMITLLTRLSKILVDNENVEK